MLKKIVPILFLFVGFQVDAAPIYYGSLSYDNSDVSNLIVDSASGLSFLSFDKVDELSLAQTLTITGNSGTFSGFHIATLAEGLSFFNSIQAGTSATTPWIDGSFGVTYTSTYDAVWFGDYTATDVPYVGLAHGQHSLNNTFGIATADTDYYTTNGHFDNIGWLLVENQYVPEPSIIALFSLGLVGLGFARRRRQA
jgi:hypothetical protein